MRSYVNNGYISPLWKGVNNVLVPNKNQVLVDPADFANETIHPQRLKHLVFTSNFVKPALGYLEHPSWSNLMLMELGKSGCSDSNLVSGSLDAFTAAQNLKAQRRQWGNLSTYAYRGSIQDPAWTYNFPTPYKLPKDTGLEVKVANRIDETALKLTFIAKGFTNEGHPRFLAASSVGLVDQSDVLLKSADLFNRGLGEINLVNMSMSAKIWESNADEDAIIIDPTGSRVGWVVNPTSGMAWMPTDVGIPAGNIAPLTQMPDWGDYGPRVYTFPKNTYLLPEQHLSIKLTNVSSEKQSLNISLISEIEVA